MADDKSRSPPPYPGGFVAPTAEQQAAYPQQPGIVAYQPPASQQPFPAMAAQPTVAGKSFDYAGADEAAAMAGFGEKAVRRAFIRKVYGILMVQLVLTAAIIAVFLLVNSVKSYVQRNQWVYWTSLVLMLVCLISMACCDSVRRKTPTNFIFLGIFTACEGVMLGTISSFYQVDAVLIAVGITAGVTFFLTLFAFQTKIDFTTCGGMLCALLVIFFIATILMFVLPIEQKIKMIGIGSAGALIFSLYIIYDTQLMMGGGHKYSISPEEYVFASLNLYLDVINLFLYILMILGACRGD